VGEGKRAGGEDFHISDKMSKSPHPRI